MKTAFLRDDAPRTQDKASNPSAVARRTRGASDCDFRKRRKPVKGICGKLDSERARIGRAKLPEIDEMGFLSLDGDGAKLLFQVISDACERQSIVFTTNLGFSKWGAVFGDAQMAAGAIDRIVHHGRLLQFNGESCRTRHALMGGSAQN